MADSAPLLPRDERDICEAVAHAAAIGDALEIAGGGTKRGIGRPNRETTILSTLGLNRVIDYDPAELVLTVESGALLSDIEALLAEQNQMLAFEPYDFADLIGGERGRSTVGGVVGAGFAGSRRLSAGGVRDHLLGFSAVNGRGEVFKAGGRVVKNVTGYDLPKLMAGSWGQLCVLTQVTLKVLPRPEASRTLILRVAAPDAAVAAMSQAMAAPAGVAAAAYADGAMALRLEGVGLSLTAGHAILRHRLAAYGALQDLDAADDWWSRIRAAKIESAENLWRIVAPPARGGDILNAVERQAGRAMLDWAGGLCWARAPAPAEAIRAIAEAAGGHAMLISASEPFRAATPARHPEPPAIAALTARVKRAFDPAGIFDPNRFAP